MEIQRSIGFSFYNNEREIPRSLSAWIPHVDNVIAIDGRYQTPETPEMKSKNLTYYSNDNSEEVLRKICGDKLIFEKYYATQIDKRQRYMDIAGEIKSDILIVWDSDDYIHSFYQDWNLFEKELEWIMKRPEETSIHYMYAWIPSDRVYPKQFNAVDSNSWQKYARVHKNPGDQKYVVTHHTFTKKKTLQVCSEEEIAAHYSIYRDHFGNPYLIQGDVNKPIEGIRLITDRDYRTSDQLEHGNNWAYQDCREDEVKLLNTAFKTARGTNIDLFDLSKPHYYKPGGMVWY